MMSLALWTQSVSEVFYPPVFFLNSRVLNSIASYENWQTRATLLKSESWVMGHSRASKETPFDSLRMISYYHPIVTLCLYNAPFSRYCDILVENHLKNLPHSHLARSFGVTPCEIFDESYLARKWNHGAIWRCTFHDPAFALLDSVPAVTDRRTDGHVPVAKTALCIASCG